MLRHLFRPAALVTHALVLTVAVTCVALGQWQLSRLGEVREHNERLQARLHDDPVALDALADPAAPAVDELALEFHRVEVEGVYRPDEEVLHRNREHLGQPGFHVLTPLELDGGAVVLVRRGWVPVEHDEPPVPQAAPPDARVTVTGLLERPVGQPGFGARDPDDGALARVFHADTARLDRQVDGRLFPMVVRLDGQTPAASGELPVALEPPVLDEANHLSYALQWHAFALIAVVTYGVWLWRRHLPRRPDERGGAGAVIAPDVRTDGRVGSPLSGTPTG